MTHSARPTRATARLDLALRRALLLCAAALALLAGALATAGPAGAIVTEVAGTKVGLQPRSNELGTENASPASFLNNEGNAVLHGSNDYLIYWDPRRQFHHEWVTNLDQFFHHLGEAELNSPFPNLSQYRDRGNAIPSFRATFGGSYSDTVNYPAEGCTDPEPLKVGEVTCLTDAQLREQLQAFIAAHNLPKGMGTVYFLLTPPGVTVCLDAAATRCSDFALSEEEVSKQERESESYKQSFCSYHGVINPNNAPEGNGNTILYAAVPWIAGTLGLSGYQPAKALYANAFDCQDGGWNSEKNEENPEIPRELTKAEELALEKMSEKERQKAEEAHALEGPHIEEPNQEGKGEYGDYAAGLTDLLVNQISEEEMNVASDPLLSSWHDEHGNEVTDMCRDHFASTGAVGVEGGAKAEEGSLAGTLSNVTLGGVRYLINNVFNAAEGNCMGAVGLIARFTSPDPVNAGEIIGLDGMESTDTMFQAAAFGPSGPPTTTFSTFSWNFGDGTPEVKGYAPGAPICESPWLSPCAASAFHVYQYGGVYNATLTVTDVGGYTTNVTHEVVVVGPPAPGSGSGSGKSSSGSGSGSGQPGTGGPNPGIPGPVAFASILHQSLRTAAHKGLVVSYSVNEQVAGRFEVLLSRAAAHRLGIGGSPATGLPAGSPAEVVIAKSILVTTKGGRSAVHIHFSKRTAARLARAHKLALLLRLVVRNAAPGTPVTTTAMTSATLG